MRPCGWLIWAGLAAVIVVPLVIAGQSPLLAWRGPAYVIAGFAGIVALAVLFVQPLVAGGYLPGLSPVRARRLHRGLGAGLLVAIALHIGGLYLTSPPDTLDALLLVSPTPFSIYGVVATAGALLTALWVALRRRVGLSAQMWRWVHNLMALAVVAATVIHALQIEGTMGQWSKLGLCALALVSAGFAIVHLRVVKPWRRARLRRS